MQTSRAYRHYTQTATSIQAEPTDGKKLQIGRKPRQQPADVHTATSPHLTDRTPRQQQPNRQDSPTAAAYKHKIRRTLRRTDSMNLQVLYPNSNRQTYIQQQAHTEVEPTNKKLEEPQRQEENKDKGQHSTDRMNPLSPVSRRSNTTAKHSSSLDTDILTTTHSHPTTFYGWWFSFHTEPRTLSPHCPYPLLLLLLLSENPRPVLSVQGTPTE